VEGTCVLAIVMLQAFEPGTLPGEEPGKPHLPMDVASFEDLLLGASKIEVECIREQHALGWQRLGKESIYYNLLKAGSVSDFHNCARN